MEGVGHNAATLGDLLVVGEPPAKLWKALAVIAEGLHAGFEADPKIIPGISKNSCVLASLTVRDFLRGVGFVNASAIPVATVMWATQHGKELHSLGIGAPDDPVPAEPGRWTGHMIVSVLGYLIDTTLYVAHRPVWPDLPGMIAVPLAPPDKQRPKWEGLSLLSGVNLVETDRDYQLSLNWFGNPRNVSWREGGDSRRERRKGVVDALVRRFGRWQASEPRRK